MRIRTQHQSSRKVINKEYLFGVVYYKYFLGDKVSDGRKSHKVWVENMIRLHKQIQNVKII